MGGSYGEFEEEAAKGKEAYEAAKDFFLQEYYSKPGSTIETHAGRATLRALAEGRKALKQQQKALAKEQSLADVLSGVPTTHATGVPGDKKKKAMERIEALTQGTAVFEEGVRMEEYFHIGEGQGETFCLCREKLDRGDGYEEWVWCDNDATGSCFGFRCYHVNCLHPSLRPQSGTFDDEDVFVCEACLREAQCAKARPAGQDKPKAKSKRRTKREVEGSREGKQNRT